MRNYKMCVRGGSREAQRAVWKRPPTVNDTVSPNTKVSLAATVRMG